MKTISVKQLERLYACKEGIAVFIETFGKLRIALTVANGRKMLATQKSREFLNWFSRRMLTDKEVESIRAATAKEESAWRVARDKSKGADEAYRAMAEKRLALFVAALRRKSEDALFSQC